MICDCCHNEIPEIMDAFHVGEDIYCEECVDAICRDLEPWDGSVSKVVRKILTKDYVTEEEWKWRNEHENLWF